MAKKRIGVSGYTRRSKTGKIVHVNNYSQSRDVLGEILNGPASGRAPVAAKRGTFGGGPARQIPMGDATRSAVAKAQARTEAKRSTQAAAKPTSKPKNMSQQTDAAEPKAPKKNMSQRTDEKGSKETTSKPKSMSQRMDEKGFKEPTSKPKNMSQRTDEKGFKEPKDAPKKKLDPSGDLVAQYKSGQGMWNSKGQDDYGREALSLMTDDELEEVRGFVRSNDSNSMSSAGDLALIEAEQMRRDSARRASGDTADPMAGMRAPRTAPAPSTAPAGGYSGLPKVRRLDPDGDLAAQWKSGQAYYNSKGADDFGREALSLMTDDELQQVEEYAAGGGGWAATQDLSRIQAERQKRSAPDPMAGMRAPRTAPAPAPTTSKGYSGPPKVRRLDPDGDLVAQWQSGQAYYNSNGADDFGREALSRMTDSQLQQVEEYAAGGGGWAATQDLSRIQAERQKRSAPAPSTSMGAEVASAVEPATSTKRAREIKPGDVVRGGMGGGWKTVKSVGRPKINSWSGEETISVEYEGGGPDSQDSIPSYRQVMTQTPSSTPSSSPSLPDVMAGLRARTATPAPAPTPPSIESMTDAELQAEQSAVRAQAAGVGEILGDPRLKAITAEMERRDPSLAVRRQAAEASAAEAANRAAAERQQARDAEAASAADRTQTRRAEMAAEMRPALESLSNAEIAAKRDNNDSLRGTWGIGERGEAESMAIDEIIAQRTAAGTWDDPVKAEAEAWAAAQSDEELENPRVMDKPRKDAARKESLRREMATQDTEELASLLESTKTSTLPTADWWLEVLNTELNKRLATLPPAQRAQIENLMALSRASGELLRLVRR